MHLKETEKNTSSNLLIESPPPLQNSLINLCSGVAKRAKLNGKIKMKQWIFLKNTTVEVIKG